MAAVAAAARVAMVATRRRWWRRRRRGWRRRRRLGRRPGRPTSCPAPCAPCLFSTWLVPATHESRTRGHDKYRPRRTTVSRSSWKGYSNPSRAHPLLPRPSQPWVGQSCSQPTMRLYATRRHMRRVAQLCLQHVDELHVLLAQDEHRRRKIALPQVARQALPFSLHAHVVRAFTPHWQQK